MIHGGLITCKVILVEVTASYLNGSRPFPQKIFWWSCYLLYFLYYNLYFNAWYTPNHALMVCQWYSELHSSFLSMSTHSMSDTLHFFLHHVRFKPPMLLMHKLSAPRQNAYDKHVTFSRKENCTYDNISGLFMMYLCGEICISHEIYDNRNKWYQDEIMFHHDWSL